MTRPITTLVLFLALIINASLGAYGEPPVNRYEVRIDRVIDGDTIKGMVLLGFDVALVGKSIRLAGFDAWELNRRRRTIRFHPKELARGREAREALVKLLGTGIPFLSPSGTGKDPYGRLVGRLTVDTPDGKTVDVALWMRQRGHHRGDRK